MSVYNKNNLKDVKKRVFFPIFGTFKLKMIPSPKYSFTHIDTVKKVIIRFIKNLQNGKNIYNISDKNLYYQNKLIIGFGYTIPLPVILTSPIYFIFSLIPGNKGYALRCLYWKLFKSNIYRSSYI